MKSPLLPPEAAKSNQRGFFLALIFACVLCILLGYHLHHFQLSRVRQNGSELNLHTNRDNEILVGMLPGTSGSPQGVITGSLPEESKFMFWDDIKETAWYTSGECRDTCKQAAAQPAHPCTHAAQTFDAIAAKYEETPPTPYTFMNSFHTSSSGAYEVSGTLSEKAYADETQGRLMAYVQQLMTDPAKRLWYIYIKPQHSFLLEQDGNEYRIYQSWEQSFSLQYWVHLSIPTHTICEPGLDILNLSADFLGSITQFGIRGAPGYKKEISQARARFGGFESVPAEQIVNLFGALGHGFLLEAMAFAPTPNISHEWANRERLIPFSESLEQWSTIPWLGKSAVDLLRLYRQEGGTPYFAITIRTVEL